VATGIVGPGSFTPQVSLQQARELQLLQQMKSATGTDQIDPEQKKKIEKGSREFEALLLSGWLQQAEQSMATVPGADDDEDPGSRDQMMSLGVQSLAGALAASGGIGIGAMIEKAMLGMAQKEQSPAPAAAVQNQAETPHFSLNSGFQSADRIDVSSKGTK